MQNNFHQDSVASSSVITPQVVDYNFLDDLDEPISHSDLMERIALVWNDVLERQQQVAE